MDQAERNILHDWTRCQLFSYTYKSKLRLEGDLNER